MKTRIIKLLIFLGLVFILSSCIFGIDDLSQDNAEYILNKYDTLIYLYNQTDTCKVSVDSYFSVGSIDYVYGFRSVTDDYGGSRFYLPHSIYHVWLSVSGKTNVIELGITLLDRNSIYYYKSDQIFGLDIKKSELINNRTILNTDYTNCYIYDSNVSPYSNKNGIQNFVYNKEYGLVQLIMKDSTRFELIGVN